MRKQNVFSSNIIWGGASRKSFQRKHSEKCQSYTKFKFLRETETINILLLSIQTMAVCSDIFLFILCLLIVGVLVFVLIYFIITLSDLECDYLNAQECCAKLNFVSSKISIMNQILLVFQKKKNFLFQWNIPKLWCQLFIVFILLISGHWLMFLIHIPISIFLIRR